MAYYNINFMKCKHIQHYVGYFIYSVIMIMVIVFMKKKNLFLLIAGLLIVLLIIIFIIILLSNNKYQAKINIKNYYMVDSENMDDYYYFQNLEELIKKFNLSGISDIDFNKYNYLAVKVTYDECSEKNVIPKNYFIQEDILNINFSYVSSCGVCAFKTTYYILSIDKNIKFKDVKMNYNSTNKIDCPSDVAYKPIIYLYPENDTNVTVKLKNEKNLITTYPKYTNEWNVFASRSGKLIDNSTGRELYGLYWEGNNYNSKVTDEGFVVAGDKTINFLEEKLSILGLNEREADEFIIYWLPKLEQNKYNYIRFASMEEINNYMPLDIEPIPDTIIRIMMEYKPLTEEITINEQKLLTPTREGFIVIEWGGSMIR